MLTPKSFVQSCTNPKGSRAPNLVWKVVIVIFLLLVLVLFIILHGVINHVPLEKRTSIWNTALPVEEIWLGEKNEEPTALKLDAKESLVAIKAAVEELKTIKVTAINDLRDIEGKRYTVLEEIKVLNERRMTINQELKKYDRDLNRLKNQLQVLRSAVASKKLEVNIPIGIPKQLKDVSHRDAFKKMYAKQSRNDCVLSTCFDYSYCSLLKQFRAFVYQPSGEGKMLVSIAEAKSVYNDMKGLPHIDNNNVDACVYVDIIVFGSGSKSRYKKGALTKHLHSLKRWESDGQNHLILLLSKLTVNETCSYVAEVATTKAILATNVYCRNSFREKFDILLSPVDFFLSKGLNLDFMPQLVPVKRTYLFAYVEKPYNNKMVGNDLLALQGTAPDIYIKLDCMQLNTKVQRELNVHCKDERPVADILKNAVFNVLFTPENLEDLEKFFNDILMSLTSNTIPVIIGECKHFPYSDFIDYKKFTIIIPVARLTEIHYILRTMKKTDIYLIRKHGRFIYETYFASIQMNAFTIFSILQSRIGLPPLPFNDVKAVPLLSASTSVITGSKNEATTLKSDMFKQNWTASNVNVYDHWNTMPGAHYLFKMKPKNDAMPPSVQFFEDLHNFMPIGNGVGGDGAVFKNALGGDMATEHFTVVILTYDRELILIESLQRLANLRYLNRVIVIWNNEIMPSKELEWPDIGVPLHVIKGEKNSLNNRFLPFDLIDTEAILSMDDDIYLRFDEIELAFRVWRENRDRIVGFPGRYHSWNMKRGWSYNASNSCELSMVLTGGAFLHKYYLYLYTYLMPQPIKAMVDDYMNCEDIAMNFLVSHVTGRPPIKVTSRWTFRCPGCPTSLSNDYTHYTERARCLQFFKEVYGYMPLRRTQFRADSVLFKTRLSPGGVKCYQFV